LAADLFQRGHRVQVLSDPTIEASARSAGGLTSGVEAAKQAGAGREGPPGVAAAGVATGGLGIGFPDDVYSPGTAGGILLVVTSLAFLAIAERANRTADKVEPADVAATA
jgi:uncharacterized membrane protein